MDKKDLLDLLNDDDLGLLDVEKGSLPVTADDRLKSSFIEICEFFSIHGTEPKTGGDIQEHKLASRLKYIRENPEQIDYLNKVDIHNLLSNTKKEPDKIEDIFGDDDLNLLALEDETIFDIKNVPQTKTNRSDPDFIAKRKVCQDFEKYSPLFSKVQTGLREGTKKLSVFIEGDMQPGDFFVHNGVLLYLEKIDNPYRGNNKRLNRRTRCIFENGTESSTLLRSLGKRLTESGYSVKDVYETPTIDENDTETGYIYLLKSESDNPRIKNIPNLFKIGFSTTRVEERIKNAISDPTYLMSPVSIVATYSCFNMNPQRFERLVHRFFSEVCLDLQITDNSGNSYTPKEWFIAPITVISQAIELIIKGEIVNYNYDKNLEKIVGKRIHNTK